VNLEPATKNIVCDGLAFCLHVPPLDIPSSNHWDLGPRLLMRRRFSPRMMRTMDNLILPSSPRPKPPRFFARETCKTAFSNRYRRARGWENDCQDVDWSGPEAGERTHIILFAVNIAVDGSGIFK
jgi:hypothetical protein